MSTTIDPKESLDRRAFLRRSLSLVALLCGASGLAEKLKALSEASGSPTDWAAPSNFRAIYLKAGLRERFLLFLKNVFHLYPEAKFHRLISELAEKYATDQEIYETLLKKLPKIRSPLSQLTYALPALKKQKLEMTRETMEFLGPKPSANGYLEIGSTGRYVSELRRHMRISGPIYLINDVAYSYELADMVERGQVRKIGTFIPMGNYDPFFSDKIPDASVDLVTNFIGLHHCPAERLKGFVRSIRRVLRPGGRYIQRDHDVDKPEMWSMVALAHDVFNAGLLMPWLDNHRQVRLFRSIDQWSDYLSSAGFKRAERRTLAQEGDPTQNLLVEFTKA